MPRAGRPEPYAKPTATPPTCPGRSGWPARSRPRPLWDIEPPAQWPGEAGRDMAGRKRVHPLRQGETQRLPISHFHGGPWPPGQQFHRLSRQAEYHEDRQGDQTKFARPALAVEMSQRDHQPNGPDLNFPVAQPVYVFRAFGTSWSMFVVRPCGTDRVEFLRDTPG